MKFDMEKAKKNYEEIKVPKELNEKLKMIIQNYDDNSKYETEQKLENKKEKKQISFKQWGCVAAAVVIVFAGMVNTSSTIAFAMYEMPIIGDFARLITFREYKYENEYAKFDLSMPNVENTGNKQLEEKINQEIEKKMNEVIEKGQKEAEEYKQLYLKQNGTEEGFEKAEVQASYEKKYSNEKILSFVIYSYNITQGMANGEQTATFYNIDLQTGKDLKLSDFLGKNYKEIANKSILTQIKERTEKDEGQMYFGLTEDEKEMGLKGFQSIKENQPFYINEKGNVVIVFDKYEIAPGAMGMPEFEIIKE